MLLLAMIRRMPDELKTFTPGTPAYAAFQQRTAELVRRELTKA